MGEAADAATVYVTGRSLDAAVPPEREGTVVATAELIADAGGVAIPVRCDHTVDADVDALFRRIGGDYGRLDLLVNNVWGRL